ncbi:hypothetical protein NRB16_08000 [Pseudomonas sp. LJDD11]|uniref:hypothetical protein n=1 Tax=Pseudomonas sp. LJDD11 TaxID=2931984 RepID=UPI00211C16C9|nr:hypothetical protein [Pseudomonas sp. LJDD11]MCQ9423462.1 hypothetical protein [Pseudomonas sp. LJDD11]
MKLFGIAGLLLLPAAACAAEFTPAEICKATISVEFGRDVKIMKAKMAGDNPEVSYSRDDGDSFKYQCQVSSDTVVWRGFLNDTRSWGRWRTRYSEGDSLLTYRIESSSLTIDSNQAESKTFSKRSF